MRAAATARPAARSAVSAREEALWDEHVPTLEQCIPAVEVGPDLNTALMLDAVEPLGGKRVLDFGCGAGLTSIWAAQRGAIVTGADISAGSIARARQVAASADVSIDFKTGEMTPDTLPAESFNAVIGRYVLHHVDPSVVAPMIRDMLEPGGQAAFLETTGLNPLLRLARHTLAGRVGVARYGSDDQRSPSEADRGRIRREIEAVDLAVAEMPILTVFARNVLRFRVLWASAFLRTRDAVCLRLGLRDWSHHQVVALTAHE